MKVQFTLKPVHYWIGLLMTVLVAGSIYFFNEGARFEDEDEDEESEEKIVLQSMDLWTSMRAYPNAEMDASAYVPAAIQSRSMSLEARSQRLGLNAPAVAPWVNLAPFNFAGRILCVAVHPTNANIMFVGSASGGLWKTTTGGTGTQGTGTNPMPALAWSYVPTGFPILGVGAVAFDPSNANTMYIGTGEVYSQNAPSTGTIGAGNIRTFRGSYGIGVLKSTDGGATWTQSLSFANTALVGVMDIIVHPTNSNIVYAATTNGLYRTTNGGASWSLILNKALAFTVRFKTDDPNNTVFASCGNFASAGTGIYKTTNASVASPTFTQLTTGLPAAGTISGKIILATTPIAPNTIYASIGNSPYIQTDPEGLYVSTDAGATWTGKQTAAASIIGGQGWYGHHLAVSRANASILLWGELDTYRSTNGGTAITKTGNWGSWDPANKAINDLTEGVTNTTAYVHADVHQIVNSANDATGNTFFVCTDGGLFRTTDAGATFRSLNGGLNTAQMYSNISMSATDPNFMLIGLQDNEAMVYDGNPGSRRITNLGDGFHTAINPSNDNICFTESYFLRVGKSTNRAATPTSFTQVITNGSGTTPAENTCFNGPFVIAKSNPTIMYGGTINVKKSTNTGATWTNVNGGANLAGPNNPILFMAVDPTNANIVYASTVPASGIRSKIFKSTNGGTSFTDITGTLPDRYYSKILIDQNNPTRIVVTLSGFGSSHAFLSTNGGTTWTDIGFGLPDVPANTAMWDPSNPNTLYIGNDLGVYYALGVPTSTVAPSYFVTWTAYNQGLGDAVMVSDMLATPGASPVIRLATFGRGLWEGPLAPAISLPARVVTFNGARQGKVNHLDWTSSVEINVNKYVVEYSVDGRHFNDVGSVNAFGNSNSPKKYSFDHSITPGTAYYRIRIVDIDGHTEYTEVVSIKAAATLAAISMFPNPTEARTTVHFGGGNTGDIIYRVVDMGGRTVLTGKSTLTGGAQDLRIDLGNRPAGMYHVVLDGSSVHWTGKLVKR